MAFCVVVVNGNDGVFNVFYEVVYGIGNVFLYFWVGMLYGI